MSVFRPSAQLAKLSISSMVAVSILFMSKVYLAVM